ncbi:hypothetical protein ACRAWG_05830 [Methylobacterium sp. P31]
MAKPTPTTGELFKAAEVSDTEVEAALDAYLANLRAEPFRFAAGYEIDVAAAVHAHQPAKAAVSDSDHSAQFKRTMVRMAILLAHPVKR